MQALFLLFLKKVGQDISRVLYQTIIYLDLPLPASSSHLPPGQRRAAAFCALFDVAPNGVYTRSMLPYLPVSSYLTISTLPRHYPFRRNVSVALSLQLPTPDVIWHPCPMEPGLSSYLTARDCLVYPQQFIIAHFLNDCTIFLKLFKWINIYCRLNNLNYLISAFQS